VGQPWFGEVGAVAMGHEDLVGILHWGPVEGQIEDE